MSTAASFEFCQYVHTDGRRCVNGFGHSGNHNVMPQSSVSVVAINRRETQLKRLAADQPPLTGEAIVKTIDTATQEQRDAIARQRAAQASIYGEVPQVATPFHGGTPSAGVSNEVPQVAPVSAIQPPQESVVAEPSKESTVEVVPDTPETLALAAEAEAGYDPDQIKPVPPTGV